MRLPEGRQLIDGADETVPGWHCSIFLVHNRLGEPSVEFYRVKIPRFIEN